MRRGAVALLAGLALAAGLAYAGAPQDGGPGAAGASDAALATGDYTGWSTNLKFGHNSAVGTSEEPIWTPSIGTLPFLTSAETLSLVSADADDTAAGAGARTVTVFGLDSAWAEASETLTLSGTVAVASTKSFVRVFRAYVETTGTYGGTNEGKLTFTAGVDGRVMATIPADEGQTQMAIWTTSATQTAYLVGLTIGIDSTKVATIHLLTRENADDTSPATATRHRIHLTGMNAGIHQVAMPCPIVLPPKTDVWASAFVPTTTADVSAQFCLKIRDTAQ